jgi:hypothetical protein
MSRWARRLVPSPAMIVALVALFMAMGGSAYALVITGKSIRNGSITGKDVKNRTLTGSKGKADSWGGGSIKESTLSTVPSSVIAFGSARYAVVNAGGQAVRSRSITSAARTGPGRYQVIFTSDVRNCAYFATPGDPTAAGPPQNRDVSVASLASNINGVAVRTENSLNGNAVNTPFHLVVFC